MIKPDLRGLVRLSYSPSQMVDGRISSWRRSFDWHVRGCMAATSRKGSTGNVQDLLLEDMSLLARTPRELQEVTGGTGSRLKLCNYTVSRRTSRRDLPHLACEAESLGEQAEKKCRFDGLNQLAMSSRVCCSFRDSVMFAREVQVPQLRQNPGQIACKLFVRVRAQSPGVTCRSKS